MNLTIPADDHGQIRVFSVATALSDALRDKSPNSLLVTLGTDALDTDFIDIFDVSALGEMTVADYIKTGYDLRPDAADLAVLQGLHSTVILVMSRAARGAAVELTLAPGVSHVTTLSDGVSLNPKAAPKSVSAQRVSDQDAPKKKPSDAAMSGRVATIALLVMFALVALMIWIA